MGKVSDDDVKKLRELRDRNYSYRRIAEKTGFAESTVKTHVKGTLALVPVVPLAPAVPAAPPATPPARDPIADVLRRLVDVLDTVRCEYGMETAEFDACVRECKARLASYEPETLDVLAVDWDQLAREAMALLALAEPIRSFLEHGAEYDIPRGGIVGQIAAQLGKAPPYLRTTGDDERRRLWSAVRLYLAAPERGWEPTPSLTDLANNP